MKKILCAASLFLAFSMSSFASTNELKEAKVSNETVAKIDDDITCYLVRITEQWVEQDGPEDDPDSYTIRYVHHRFILCFED